jgi:hypothetical protein
MFHNRIYFTTKLFYRLLKQKSSYNRKHITTNSGGGGGNGDPKTDYILTAILVSCGFYIVNMR